jgi:dienelactone hydrolase
MPHVRMLVAALVSMLPLAGGARAAVKVQEIAYEQGGTPLKGFLAYDDAVKGKRPGVLVIHEWWGLNDYAREQARRLAEAGYVAFAADMYGNGKVAKHPADAQAFVAEATKDPGVVAARFDAAMAVLGRQPRVDASRVAAVGYCFGGGVALRMARAGAPLAAVATFHAAIPPPAPVEKGTVKPEILIQTGGADPMVPVPKVETFADELKAAGAKVDVVVYPEARHSFTVPGADREGMEGLRYDPDAAKKSWTRMIEFFRRVLKA